MFATIINDCRDDNARGRQESRLAALIDTPVSFVGVDSDLEAGVQLLDNLDATEGRRGIVLVNVAPRGGHTTKWENGTPFGYFKYNDTLIIASVDGYTLSGVKKFNLAENIALLDTHTGSEAMLAAGFISTEAAAHLPASQFRSFDFLPRIAAFLLAGHSAPTSNYSLENVPDLPQTIWHVDNFGNCKTTLTTSDLRGATKIQTRFGELPFIAQLRNVPDQSQALVQGSSGLVSQRFLELVAQRSNFSKQTGAKIGDAIFTTDNFFRHATN